MGMKEIETLRMDLTTAGRLSRANGWTNLSQFLRALARKLGGAVLVAYEDGTEIHYNPQGHAVVKRQPGCERRQYT